MRNKPGARFTALLHQHPHKRARLARVTRGSWRIRHHGGCAYEVNSFVATRQKMIARAFGGTGAKAALTDRRAPTEKTKFLLDDVGPQHE